MLLGALGSDELFVCTARNADRLLSQYVTTYAYEFNDENAPSVLPAISFPLGAYHFSEVPYLFHFGASPALTLTVQVGMALALVRFQHW